MSNNYAPCFNRIDFVVISSSIEFPCLGVTVLSLFIYMLLVTVLYQKQFFCYIFDREFFRTSLNISMNKLSLKFLVKSQSSFTFIKDFIYDKFNFNCGS